MLMTLPKVTAPSPGCADRGPGRAVPCATGARSGSSASRETVRIAVGDALDRRRAWACCARVVQALREWSRMAGWRATWWCSAAKRIRTRCRCSANWRCCAEHHDARRGHTRWYGSDGPAPAAPRRPDTRSNCPRLAMRWPASHLRMPTDACPGCAQITAWSEPPIGCRIAQPLGAAIPPPTALPTHAMASAQVPSRRWAALRGRRPATFAFDVSSNGWRPPQTLDQRAGQPAALAPSCPRVVRGNTWARQQPAQPAHRLVQRPGGRHARRMAVLLQDRRTHAVWSLTPSSLGRCRCAVPRGACPGNAPASATGSGELDMAVHWSVDPDHRRETGVCMRDASTGATRCASTCAPVAMVEWLMGEKRSDRATLAHAAAALHRLLPTAAGWA